MYNIINVLQVVLRSLDGGPSSLHIHRDVRHFVYVLHPRYLNRLLCASNGGNLSLIRLISSLLHVLMVLRSFLFGFKLMFLSPPILVQPVPGMNDFLCLLLVSNFKLGPHLFHDGCVAHRSAVILQTTLGFDLRLVNFVFISVILCLLSQMIIFSRRRDDFLCNLNCWNVPLHDHKGVHHPCQWIAPEMPLQSYASSGRWAPVSAR